MKDFFRIISLIMIMIGVFCLYGCGEDDNGAEVSGNVSEDYFEWKDNIIIGLTDKGAKQKKLVIPKRCEGFNCLLLYDNTEVKEISFESDKDIDLNSVFFSAENLEKVTLPAELSEIGELEFYGCSSLKEISIPAGVSVIEGYAFQNNISLEKVTFEGNTTAIGMRAFDACTALNTIVLPDSLFQIGDYAFYGCTALENIAMPSSISEIGKMAFANSGVADVIFPEQVELTAITDTSFVQVDHVVVIHVHEGSWMDEHFEELFDGLYEKSFN